MAHSVGAAEYTDCISTEVKIPSKECPVYDTKQSDGEAPLMLQLWGRRSTPSLNMSTQLKGWVSRLGLENTTNAYLQRGKISPNGGGEGGLHLHCNRFLVHTGLEWQHLIRSYLWVK